MTVITLVSCHYLFIFIFGSFVRDNNDLQNAQLLYIRDRIHFECRERRAKYTYIYIY